MNWPYRPSSSLRSDAGPLACNTAIKSEGSGGSMPALPSLLTNTKTANSVANKQNDPGYDTADPPSLDLRESKHRVEAAAWKKLLFCSESEAAPGPSPSRTA